MRQRKKRKKRGDSSSTLKNSNAIPRKYLDGDGNCKHCGNYIDDKSKQWLLYGGGRAHNAGTCLNNRDYVGGFQAPLPPTDEPGQQENYELSYGAAISGMEARAHRDGGAGGDSSGGGSSGGGSSDGGSSGSSSSGGGSGDGSSSDVGSDGAGSGGGSDGGGAFGGGTDGGGGGGSFDGGEGRSFDGGGLDTEGGDEIMIDVEFEEGVEDADFWETDGESEDITDDDGDGDFNTSGEMLASIYNTSPAEEVGVSGGGGAGGATHADSVPYQGPVVDIDISNDRPGTAVFYRNRLRHPIYKGAKKTLLEWLVEKISLRIAMSRDHFDAWIASNVSDLPKQDLICPTTWKLCVEILGVENFWDFIHHFCPCGTFRYGQIPKSQYEAHADDECSQCQQKRFARLANGKLEPKAWCFYLPLATTIRMLFSNAEFVTARGKGRVYSPHSFYGSEFRQYIDAWFESHNMPEAVLEDVKNSAYAIFVDFFGSQGDSHSTGAVLLRNEDLSVEDKGKLRNCHVIMMWSGKPPYARLHMELIAQDFKQYTFKSRGLLIDHAIEVDDDGVVKAVEPFYHKPILVGLDADIPAGQWTGEMQEGSQGYCVCFKCKLTGKKSFRKYRTNATIYLGYAKRTKAKLGLGNGKKFQIGVNDSARRYTPREYRKRVRKVKKDPKPDPQKRWGVRGACVFIEELPYLRYDAFFRLPISHTLLLGLFKDFLRELFAWAPGGRGLRRQDKRSSLALPAADIRKIAALLTTETFTATCDFNRVFKPIQKLGSYKCEDFLRAVEVFLPFIREDIIGVKLPNHTFEMFHSLRNAVLHYMHGCDEADYAEEVRDAAYMNLRYYAVLLEVNKLYFLLTSNLHRANCWLPELERLIGLVAQYNELWGERGLGSLKKHCHKTLLHPEKTLSKVLLREHAIKRTQLEVFKASIASGSLPNLASNGGSTDLKIDCFDGEVGLQGYGAPVDSNSEDFAIVMKGLEELVSAGLITTEDFGWTEDDLAAPEELQVFVHSRAVIHNTRTVHSVRYNRPVKRDSTIVKIVYPKGGDPEVMEDWVAVVKFFVRVTKPNRVALRFAIVDFYEREEPLIVGVEGNRTSQATRRAHSLGRKEFIWRATKGKFKEDERNYPVLLQSIDCLLMKLEVKQRNGEKKLFFKDYGFLSKI